MIHYRRVQREDREIATITCNKCGKIWNHNDRHPDITEITNTYGYGSLKDGDKYVAHVCEPCMDEFYATFAVKPQIVGMLVWGEDSGDPVRYVAYPEAERLLRELAKELETGEPVPESGFNYAANLRVQLDSYFRDCTPDERETLMKLSTTLYGDPLSSAVPVAPAVEDHEPQEETS